MIKDPVNKKTSYKEGSNKVFTHNVSNFSLSLGHFSILVQNYIFWDPNETILARPLKKGTTSLMGV
ncbi:hypothetical protein AWM68_02075 [Fictibacillus phosphorivorans]|uniref:Uncharacterized protein n=1 Tax=Fictibacillus phosphorivorans TaxID=1221500 RepID=A0A165P5U7_9BACL|nr:hypothetical protein AWM68_02075 [Fictibacillus phosphorivorans]